MTPDATDVLAPTWGASGEAIGEPGPKNAELDMHPYDKSDVGSFDQHPYD